MYAANRSKTSSGVLEKPRDARYNT